MGAKIYAAVPAFLSVIAATAQKVLLDDINKAKDSSLFDGGNTPRLLTKHPHIHLYPAKPRRPARAMCIESTDDSVYVHTEFAMEER